MKIVELRHWTEAASAEIRERAKNGSACQLTKKYSVSEDGDEIAYLALDWWPLSQRTDLALYELFVPRKFRHRGIGARILVEVEKLAVAAGYHRVVLTARPLEDYPKGKLCEWYRRHGFKRCPKDGPDAMGKHVKVNE